MSASLKTPSLTLIYDAECDFCSKLLSWLRRQDRYNCIELLAYQDENCQRRYPKIGAAECRDGGKLILPNGKMISGVDTAPHMLRVLPGWAWAAAILSIPGVLWLVRPVYRYVARNRMAISCKLNIRPP